MNEFHSIVEPGPAHAMDPWFVVQIKPNAEAIAKRNLLRQNLRIFAPFEEVTARKAGKLFQTCKPLFPGYLFVNFAKDAGRYGAVNSTYGVSRLVSFAEGRPAQIPASLISSLMKRCDTMGKLLPPTMIGPGEQVQIKKGPLVDLVGVVEQLAPNQRVWVLLDILGQDTRVAIKTADLRITSAVSQ
jgi:transcriptional antiterminator RfaH